MPKHDSFPRLHICFPKTSPETRSNPLLRTQAHLVDELQEDRQWKHHYHSTFTWMPLYKWFSTCRAKWEVLNRGSYLGSCCHDCLFLARHVRDEVSKKLDWCFSFCGVEHDKKNYTIASPALSCTTSSAADTTTAATNTITVMLCLRILMKSEIRFFSNKRI